MPQAHLISPRSAKPWLIAWIVWLLTLWFLSESHPQVKTGPEIPHLDKICHFGYFFGGAALLYSSLTALKLLSSFAYRYWITIAIGAIIGALDEWHQTFTPGRSGNDFYDWLADVSGSMAGAAVMAILHFRFRSKLVP